MRGRDSTRGWARRAATLVALSACLAAPAGASAQGGFVGLGDSWASGPAIPLYEQPWGCLKSTNNYAHHAAPRLGLDLRDASCGGAETEDMTQSQGVFPEPNPPQFDRLTADTDVVTLLIGGNDIGFSGLAEDCFSPTPNPGSPCRDQYTAGGSDEVSRRIEETGPKVLATIQGIRSRAPSAEIYVLNYSAIFPHSGGGCYPLIPVADGDVAWLQSKQIELNEMIAAQVAQTDATLVDVYSASVGHDACQPPVIRWVEPAVPGHLAAPVHPNIHGMLAMADLVVAAAGP